MIWSANASSTNIRTTILQSAARFPNVRQRDMWFCGSPDKYVFELFICNMNTQKPKCVLAINKNAFVNFDVTSEFDVDSWILLKS